MNEVARIQNSKAILYQGEKADMEAVYRDPPFAPIPGGGKTSIGAIVLAAAELIQTSPPRGVEGLVVPLHDTHLTTSEQKKAILTAAEKGAMFVLHQLTTGKKVLVNCNMGLNRSGLIVGLTLRMLGYDGDTAVAMVRRARGPRALFNDSFRRLVEEWRGLPTSRPVP